MLLWMFFVSLFYEEFMNKRCKVIMFFFCFVELRGGRREVELYGYRKFECFFGVRNSTVIEMFNDIGVFVVLRFL